MLPFLVPGYRCCHGCNPPEQVLYVSGFLFYCLHVLILTAVSDLLKLDIKVTATKQFGRASKWHNGYSLRNTTSAVADWSTAVTWKSDARVNRPSTQRKAEDFQFNETDDTRYC